MPNHTSAHRGTITIARSRGAITGLLLVALGIWGAIIPFVGPYFSYDYTPDTTWTLNSARVFLEVLPGAATFLGGLLLLGARDRITASFGGWLAAAAGAWFIVGPLLAPNFRTGYLGTPIGTTSHVSLEQIGMFYGLGGAILLVSAFALGRFSVVGVRDAALADRRAGEGPVEAEAVRHEERRHDGASADGARDGVRGDAAGEEPVRGRHGLRAR